MTDTTQARRNFSGLIVGFSIIAAGVLFTLDNLGLIEAGHYIRYWPAVLVAVGVARLVQTESWSGYAWDLGLIVVGLWLLGEQIGLVSISIWRLWPIVLVLIGLSIVRRVFMPAECSCATLPADDVGAVPGDGGGPAQTGGIPASGAQVFGAAPRSLDSHVSMLAIMGGYERSSDTASFRSASLTAFMGGCELDLRHALMAGEEAVVDVMAVMGGIEIRVPTNWTVEVKVLPLLGGVGDETKPDRSAATGRLVLRGVVLMGGVEVKN